MNLKEILHNIQYVLNNGNINEEITDITNDSREVKKGGLFVCILGYKTDGHKYINQAVENGAAAVIVTEDVQRSDVTVIRVDDSRRALAQASCAFYGNPTDKLKVIGVTGTNGKTTVTHLIKSIIDMNGKTAGLIGTNITVIGDKVIEASRTTPEACQLQKWFKQMLDAGQEYCVMEVSSHSIELQRIAGCKFEIGIFTNLTHDHLDFHVTMENYMKAKAKLFDISKKAIINIDDEYGQKMLDFISCKKIITYGIENKKADFCAEDINLSDKGIIYNAQINGNMHKIKAMLPGKFSVYNTLAALAACNCLGFDAQQIAKGLIIAKGAAGRAEPIQIPAPFKVIIDYAHTPDALINILTTLREFSSGRIILVFGAAGDRDMQKRPVMGEIAGNMADFCIITSDNPASEVPMDIIRQVEEGTKKTECPYICIEDREKAVLYALETAREGDIVLLAGKGHETYQIIGDEKVHFSEEEIVRNYFKR